MEPSPVVETLRVAYKASGFQRARKQTALTANLRHLERLVLEFASKHMFVSAAGVREYARQRYGLSLSLKRIHDAIVRLVKRGFLEKVAFGVYRLTQLGRNALAVLFNSSNKRESKESESKAVGVRSKVSSSGVVGSEAGFDGKVYTDGGSPTVVFSRARLHALNARSLEDLVKQLFALYKATACALSYLKVLLGRRRFYRIVRDVSVACVDCFVGGHGTSVLGKSKSLRRPLIDLSFFESLGLKPKEIGVDVLAVVTGIGRLSVKVYFG